MSKTKEDHWEEITQGQQEADLQTMENEYREHLALANEHLNIFPAFGDRISKDKITRGAERIALLAGEGVINPGEMYLTLRAIEEVCKDARERIEEKAEAEFRKYGKSGELLGAKFELKNGRANYKYDSSPAIVKLAEQLKAAQELAKTLAKTGSPAVYDTTTGEEIAPARVEYSKDVIAVTFK